MKTRLNSEIFLRAKSAHQKGNLIIAEGLYRQVLERTPARSDCEHFLAIALYQQRRYGDAVNHFRRAIALEPNNAVYLSNLGSALQESSLLTEAISCFNQALAINENFPDAYFNLGNTFSIAKRPDDAIKAYTEAIARKSDYTAAFVHRGVALLELKRVGDALADFDAALSIDPRSVNAYINRADALRQLGRVEDALESIDCAVALDDTCAEGHFNRAQILQEVGRVEEALLSYDRAIACRSEYPKALSGKGTAYLKLGRFDEGWPLYEWRWHPALTKSGCKHVTGERWFGDKSLSGKTILLYAEQGLGDTIQFCRFAALVQALGARVVLQVQTSLIPLLRTLRGYDQLIDEHAPLPEVDYVCPLMSVPLALRTRIDTIPMGIPYLAAEVARIERWKHFLGTDGFKIAVAWQGNKQNEEAFGRSYPVQWLSQLSGIPSVQLISLQKHAGEELILELPVDQRPLILPETFDSDGAFLDSAAIMKCVDLVLTSDTALTHLAGALGVKTWMPLKYAAEWRWMLHTDRTPWYPEHRLFRQTRIGHWASVLGDIKAKLTQLVGLQDDDKPLIKTHLQPPPKVRTHRRACFPKARETVSQSTHESDSRQR